MKSNENSELVNSIWSVKIIKNKRLFLLCACLGLIVITLSISSAIAYPPPTVEKPTFFVTLHGEKIYGDINSLQTNDGNIIHWQGKKYSVTWWWWWWITEVEIFFDSPAGSYPYVLLQLEFKYTGGSPLRIIVVYDQGGSKEFEESSTGGNYVLRTYILDPYQKVDHVFFYNTHFLTKQYLWVDFVHAGYDIFPV